MYVNDNNILYFDSFGIKRLPKRIKKFKGNKNIITNIYGIQVVMDENNKSITNIYGCHNFCIGFIDFMLKKGKSFLGYTNLYSPNEYKKVIKYY